MPWVVVSSEDGNKHCVHKENADGSAGKQLKCYDNKADARAYQKALYANAPESEHMSTQEALKLALEAEEDADQRIGNFLFVELSGLTEAKYIDGLASGRFTAMNGKTVTFKPEELPEYVENTKRVIESTKDSKGIVGLPIDLDAHDHKGGAGWIVDATLDKARNVILLAVKWLDEGIEVIKSNKRRFFSPSTNPANKAILGGSLTNWPASRNDAGHIMLRPVELSEQLQEIDMEELIGTLANLPERISLALQGDEEEEGIEDENVSEQSNQEGDDHMSDTSTTKNPRVAELMSAPGVVAEAARQAKEQAELLIKAEQRRVKITEYVSTLVGGTAAKPFGLPVPAGEMVEFLMSLDEEHGDWAMKMFTQAHSAAIEFAERGSNIRGSGSFIGKPQLPEWAKPLMKKWVEADLPIAEFFEKNPEVGGTVHDYNLSEFVEKKEK